MKTLNIYSETMPVQRCGLQDNTKRGGRRATPFVSFIFLFHILVFKNYIMSKLFKVTMNICNLSDYTIGSFPGNYLALV